VTPDLPTWRQADIEIDCATGGERRGVRIHLINYRQELREPTRRGDGRGGNVQEVAAGRFGIR
jgi:hypothetical protein